MKNIFSKTTKYLSYFSALLVLFSTGSCASDNVSNNAEEVEPKEITEFSTADPNPLTISKSNETGIARTTGEYSGSGVDFYWTADDNIWLNTGTASTPDLVKSYKSNIPEQLVNNVTKTAKATFNFGGSFANPTYMVRYTGTNSTAGDKVTIAASQAQVNPNSATHLGTSGDCGTATATKQADGKYKFSLDHKASYITFLPYTSTLAGAKIISIEVRADENIAGTYDFNDNGIVTSNPTSPSNSISLKLNNGTGFPIQSDVDKTKNGAIMVICPGTYNNFTVKYTVLTSTGAYTFASKNFGTVTFNAGKNKKVSMDVKMQDYGADTYYQWDAAEGEYYWKGYESVMPTVNNKNNSKYPRSGDSRFTIISPFGTPASHSAKNCPNANEIFWYVWHGDPHWDNTTTWSMGGVPHTGGVWIKKQSVIAKEQGKTIAQMKTIAPNGNDYRTYPDQQSTSGTIDCTQGIPANIDDYFYLPALGSFAAGTLKYIGDYARYYSSTITSNNSLAYILVATSTYVRLETFGVQQGLPLWTAQ